MDQKGAFLEIEEFLDYRLAESCAESLGNLLNLYQQIVEQGTRVSSLYSRGTHAELARIVELDHHVKPLAETTLVFDAEWFLAAHYAVLAAPSPV